MDGALLAACGCDPHEFMTRFVREHPGFPKNLANPSLLPLDLAAKVPSRMHVRLVIGDKDDVVRLPASRAYAQALMARGVDVSLTIAPGYGHNDILRAPQTLAAMTELLALEGVTVRRLSPAAAPVSASK